MSISVVSISVVSNSVVSISVMSIVFDCGLKQVSSWCAMFCLQKVEYNYSSCKKNFVRTDIGLHNTY